MKSKKKFPKRSPYLIFRKISRDEYEVSQAFDSKTYYTDRKAAAFLKRLDGKTNPYHLPYGYSKTDVKQLLRELHDKNMLIPDKKITPDGIGSFMYPLVYCYPKRIHRQIASVVNFLLLLSFIPVFILGWYVHGHIPTYIYMLNKWEIIVACLVGLAVGITCHELAHACAGLAYGGQLFEFGIGLNHFAPAAYSLIDMSGIKSRIKQVQVYAAGIECNLLLYGICMCLVPSDVINPLIIYVTGLVNLGLAIGNSLPFAGVDGLEVLSLIVGKEDLLKQAKERIRSSKRQRKPPKFPKNIKDAVALTASYVLVAFQFVLPVLLVYEGFNWVRLIWH